MSNKDSGKASAFTKMILLHSLVLLCMIWGCVGQWSYSYEDGQDTWGTEAPECDGSNQSPIDIDTLVAEVDTSMDAIVLTQYNLADVGHDRIETRVGDHYVYLSSFDNLPHLTGGGLAHSYTLYKIYFHWGSVDTQGSEHRMDGRAYPMEVQFIHYDEAYDSWDSWLNMRNARESGAPDALAGLAVLFEISDVDNPIIDSVMTDLINAWATRQENFIAFNLDLLLPTDLSNFARYTGSCTFPDCEEIVVWTIFKETIPISSAQMQHIRSTVYNRDDPPTLITDCFRTPKPLNERTVFVSGNFLPTTTTTTTSEPPATAAANEQGNSNNEIQDPEPATGRATPQHASLCVILVALVAVCQLF